MKTVQENLNVCVIGAGVCGIVTIKACLESGFNVTCFDKSPNYGGLWCYHDDQENPEDGFVPTVMKTTILNTSKELSAFSDFPPPAHLPNFMKHNLYMDYIRSYVEHFKILPHIKLKHEVLQCEPQFNEETNQIEWLVDVKDIRANDVRRLKFDKLIVAVGHHNIPHMPTIPEQHKFKGQIIHSARVKDVISDDRFVDKRVAIIGFGNSACDVANDLAMVTKKCYVASHRGNWFFSRLTSNGLGDFQRNTRSVYYPMKYVPKSFSDAKIIKRVERNVNHDFLGFTPKHKPSEHVPTINDLFPYRVFTGGVTLKNSVSRFTEKGVIFEGEEDSEYEVDIVILATGYTARFPFLNESELGIKSAEDDEYELYLNMFAPKLSVPATKKDISMDAVKSFAIIGYFQPAGSITVVSELQARFVALIFEGKCNLPSVGEMMKAIKNMRRKRMVAIRSHSRDQLVGSWIGFLDKIAIKMGVMPNLSKLFFKDFALWKQLIFGPSVPYQYRLIGPGKWQKARETIMTVNDRVYGGINDGKNHILFQTRRKCLAVAEKDNK